MISTIIPTKGREFVDHGSWLVGFRGQELKVQGLGGLGRRNVEVQDLGVQQKAI